MRGILVQLPHHQAAGVMVRRPTGFMRLPIPSALPLRPAAISLPSSPRCAATSSSSAEDSGAAKAAGAAIAAAAEKRPSPWLFVGLGNPGTKYQGTRHNVGFDMIDAIARAEGISLSTIQFKALVGKGQIGGSPVLLAKPQTYMNLSGESVKPLASYYKIPAERVLTIYDDLDLEFAVMRLLPKGGHGGHNGMRSVLQHFSSRDIARMRIGIGRPPGQMDVQAYVLQKFSASERQELDFALDRGVEAIRLITSEGLDKAVSTWNQVRKSKISKMTYSDIKVQ